MSLDNEVESAGVTLSSIEVSVPEYLFDAVLVANGDYPELSRFLDCLEGDVEVIRLAQVAPVLHAWSLASEAAKGEYLMFLPRGAIVRKGCLESGIAILEDASDLDGIVINLPDSLGTPTPCLLASRIGFERVGGIGFVDSTPPGAEIWAVVDGLSRKRLRILKP